MLVGSDSFNLAPTLVRACLGSSVSFSKLYTRSNLLKVFLRFEISIPNVRKFSVCRFELIRSLVAWTQVLFDKDQLGKLCLNHFKLVLCVVN